jgi:hypothetical protein
MRRRQPATQPHPQTGYAECGEYGERTYRSHRRKSWLEEIFD